MSTRSSSRKASLKAKEAIMSSRDKKGSAGAGSKRQQSSAAGPKPKREKTEGAAEPSQKREEASQSPKTERKRTADGGHDEKGQKAERKRSHEKPQAQPAEKTEAGVRKSEEREEVVSSNILEKGIIYFFFRPRVNVEDPHGVEDVSRSFLVLRPTPKGAVLDHGQGSVAPESNCRLMILPKKRFPTSSKEREMGFVEKAGMSVKQLQEDFMAGAEYQTATRGERHRPDARPYAEGVYAITSTKRASHLAYIITIPSELGDLQHDFGLRQRGSWIFQSKSPKFPGPSYARLPKDPEYPEHVLEKFRDLRWVPLEPEFINYPNAQFLMIGEAQDELGKAAKAEPGGKQPHEEEPGEELEKLEHENEERIESLAGDHTVYEDLGLDAKNYPKVPSTWSDE